MTPVANPLGNGSTHLQDGGILDLAGVLSGVSGGQFTLATMQAVSGISQMADANTQFPA